MMCIIITVWVWIKLYEDENRQGAEVLNVLNLLNNFYTENPNKMINQFFPGKSTELVKLFSKAPQQDKIRASDYCKNWM